MGDTQPVGDEIGALLAEHCPQPAAADATFRYADSLWSRARRWEQLANELAPTIKPRGDRANVETLAARRMAAEILRDQAKGWLIIARTLGADFRWTDYVTEDSPDPGFLEDPFAGPDVEPEMVFDIDLDADHPGNQR